MFIQWGLDAGCFSLRLPLKTTLSPQSRLRGVRHAPMAMAWRALLGLFQPNVADLKAFLFFARDRYK